MAYYYAGGERHELDPVHELVAVDVRGAEGAEPGYELGTLAVVSRLPGGLAIVDRAALGDARHARLQAAGLLQRVYRSGRALVVPMPEVRVELDAGQQEAVRAASAAAPMSVETVDETPERMTLRPSTGRGEDALDLANFIYEHAHPAAASARMLQVVPKRGTER